jgi:cytochrome c biogenesis protein CcdA
MTHLPFIVATYALGLAVPVVFAIGAWRRLAQARRRLAAVDPRAGA